MARTIDLRKKTIPQPQNQSTDKEAVKVTGEEKQKNVILTANTSAPEMSWSAPSFYFNPQKRYLSLLVIALAGGGSAMLFYQKDTLTSIFLLLSSLVLILYSGRKPEISKIKINNRGVSVGEIAYPYRDLKSFWIHYDPGMLKELSVESKKWYMPYIKVSIEDNNPLAIRSLLISFLPEREHEHSLIDIIARKMGL